ncbi:unnamed protein product [Didymodactylos carnosus]|nr:unnamed protein product [Didymodactylos carnosus]CAF4416380.1 unnamed protein product [Didymodactylos carnosus]
MENELMQTISQENAALFTEITISDDPMQLLINGLDKQDPQYKGYVYHYTHLENAVSILNEGKLKSRNSAEGQFKNSAALNVIKSTDPSVKNYARFYFRPITPTQFCNENLGKNGSIERFGNDLMCPVPIFFKISLKDLANIPDLQWKISTGNMASYRSKSDNTLDIVKLFDFNGVYESPSDEYRYQHSSQQEYLIESELNLYLVYNDLSIICQNDLAMNSVKQLLNDNNAFLDKIFVDSSFYHNKNAKINIDNDEHRLTVSLNGSKEQGEIIVKFYNSVDDQFEIKGDIGLILNNNSIISVYVKQHITLMINLKNINYSVFYISQDENWLVYTNSRMPLLHLVERNGK